MRTLVLCLALLAATASAAQPVSRAAALPPGYWPVETSGPIIAKTQTVRLTPDISGLTVDERTAVAKLAQVGAIFQDLYELQRHPEALKSRAALTTLDRRLGSAATQNLMALYRLSQGPIATTLENRREPFLPAAAAAPGANVWPRGIAKPEVEAYLAAHPDEAAGLMHPRTVVRRAAPANVRADLAMLKKYPVLDTLHPGLRARLEGLARRGGGAGGLYAAPYSVAYGDQLVAAHRLLSEAADLVAKDDEAFARYLRNRARDLLSDDYESGDAAWITGRFKRLNAQIGSYETYDDALYGVKTFFGFSILSTQGPETEALRRALRGLQALEDSLPYDARKRVREDIPVGVYDVLADFGQTRGGNTATILPNETYLARSYGRTILLRANIMRNPDIFAGAGSAWKAAIADQHDNDLTSEGNFHRTLWHEVGHYVGVDLTRDGRDLDAALQDDADLLEEMKADLASLYAGPMLRAQGYYTDQQLRAVYASGINRVLQNNRPRRDQAYNTMQLMQWNFFLENGLLRFDRATGTLVIDYGRYHAVVGELLKQVLAVQLAGDKPAADRFVERWTAWDETLHGVVAKNIRDQQQYRFRIFRYAVIGEAAVAN